jgi:hypothetical protein
MPNPPTRLVLALVLAAATARLIAAVVLGDTLLFTDERDYVDAATSVRAGHGFGVAYARVPAYPLVLVGLGAIAPFGVAGLRAVQAVVAAGGTALTVAVATRVFGPGPGLVAGLLYALDPLLVIAAGLLYPEALTAPVFLLVVLAANRAARRGDVVAAGATGLLLGLAAQLRPVALVLTPVVAAWIALRASRRQNRSGALVGALVLACLAVLAPWTIRNYRVHGVVVPIATAGTQQAPVARDDLRKHGVTVALASKASQNPGGVLVHIAREVWHFFEPYPTRLATDRPEERAREHAEDSRLPSEQRFRPGVRDAVSAVTYGGEMALAVVGIVVAWRERRSGTLLLAAIVAAYAIGFGFFIGRLRYRIPILPLLFAFAGAGACEIARRLGPTVPRPPRTARPEPQESSADSP